VARLLFVDDEVQVLRGLERMLRPKRHEWAVAFESSALAALERLDREHFDLLVTDLRMPQMDGKALLEAVSERHPSLTRVVLSGDGDADLLLVSAAMAHQTLMKPFDGDDLCQRIEQALSMRGLLHDSALVQLVARLRRLPSLPSSYLEIVGELQRPYPSSVRVAHIVSRDMAMAAKLLQIVNSAMFGLHQEIRDAETAVRTLGLDLVRSLALTAHLFSRYERHLHGLDVGALWAHAIRVSELARTLMQRLGRPAPVVNDAMTAGLLHDVGKLVLANGLDGYEAILAGSAQARRPLHEVELERLGTTHAHVGGYLLGIWGLPTVIVDAVARHHERGAGAIFDPRAAVFLADRLVRRGGGVALLDQDDRQWLDAMAVADWRTTWEDCR
jgi:HD-like signal output (HDOD) protein/CheY-like chemotaxis protein